VSGQGQGGAGRDRVTPACIASAERGARELSGAKLKVPPVELLNVKLSRRLNVREAFSSRSCCCSTLTSVQTLSR
jgi:hypothetical protein